MGCHGTLNGLRVAPGVCRQPTHSHACSSVRSSFAAFITSMAGIPSRSWPTRCSPTVQARSSRCRQRSARMTLPRIVAAGSTLIAESEDAMSWRIGDHGFQMTLSARLPELIARNLRGWLDGWLSAHGLTVAAVGSWAVHPGGPRILAAVGESLGIDRRALDFSHAVLAEYGNMSSPTVLFIIERLQETKAPRPWVALGFGPGLAIEAVLLA